MDYVRRLIEEAAVVVAPGNGFGPAGEGYFRIAFTLPDERLAEAMQRIEAFHSNASV
jgi:LL-diaminopimelate aminotransferase